MPVTDRQRDAIAYLVTEKRATVDAPRWDRAGVLVALEKVAHLDLTDVTLAAMRAADDTDLRTPGSIGNPNASCWRERRTDRPQPREPYFGAYCDTCGQKPPDAGGRCVGHTFVMPVERAGERRPLRELMHSTTTERNEP